MKNNSFAGSFGMWEENHIQLFAKKIIGIDLKINWIDWISKIKENDKGIILKNYNNLL